MSVKDNIAAIKNRIGDEVRLVAVSKYTTNDKIHEAYEAGQRDFGENKAQDLVAKKDDFPSDMRWHFIGHLQRNKVKYIADFIHLIHAVDSLKLLKEINKQAAKSERVIPCLLQMHIAEEDTKFGLSREEILEIISSEQLAALENVEVVGLMGMATNTDDEGRVRREFKVLRSLFEEIKANMETRNVRMEELSMGMSQDYHLAVQEGTTMVRIGTAVFK
jgi:pyridoxal phosphate enzyme (YggS family)